MASAAAVNHDSDPAFMDAKLITARFFAQRIMPETVTLRRKIEAGAEAVMAMPVEAF